VIQGIEFRNLISLEQRFHCGLGLSLLGTDGEKRERKNSGGRAGVLICQDSKAGGDGGKQQKIGV